MTLVWEELPAWWQADVEDPASRSVVDGRTTYRIFRASDQYELWVRPGPNEEGSVVGKTRAALRCQKRAKRLGSYARLSEAKEAAGLHRLHALTMVTCTSAPVGSVQIANAARPADRGLSRQ